MSAGDSLDDALPSLDTVKVIGIILVVGFAAFVGYKAYKGAVSIKEGVSDALEEIGDAVETVTKPVTDAVGGIVAGAQGASDATDTMTPVYSAAGDFMGYESNLYNADDVESDSPDAGGATGSW